MFAEVVRVVFFSIIKVVVCVAVVVELEVEVSVSVVVDGCTTAEGSAMMTRPRAAARTSTTKDRPIVALEIANLRRRGTMKQSGPR